MGAPWEQRWVVDAEAQDEEGVGGGERVRLKLPARQFSPQEQTPSSTMDSWGPRTTRLAETSKKDQLTRAPIQALS